MIHSVPHRYDVYTKTCLNVTKPRIRFYSPSYSDIVIYDEVGSEFLIPALDGEFTFQIMKVRRREINLHPRVLFRLLILVVRLVVKDKEIDFTRNPLALFELALLNTISPKIVVTFIDNSIRFNMLSRIASEMRFLAIQNGFRGPEIAQNLRQHSTRNLFCFGEDTKRRYLQAGCRIDTFLVGGSIKMGLFAERYPHQIEKKYDLCWVSQYRPKRFSGGLPGLEKTSLTLLEWIKLIAERHELTLTIAGSAKLDALDQEVSFYDKIFDLDNVRFVPNNPLDLTSYKTIAESKVTVTVHSTIGFEMLAAGSKVMFCNFADDPFFDVPGQDSSQPWILSGAETTFEEFESKLFSLHNLDEQTWNMQSQPVAQEFVRFSRKEPSTRELRSILRQLIAEQDESTALKSGS